MSFKVITIENQWGMSMPRSMKFSAEYNRDLMKALAGTHFDQLIKRFMTHFEFRRGVAWRLCLLEKFCFICEESAKKSIHFWLQRTCCFTFASINGPNCFRTKRTPLTISLADGKPISRLSRRKGSIFDLVWWRRFWMWRAKGSLNLACQSSVSSILPHSQDRAMGKEHGGKEHGGMRSGHGASLLRSRFRILWSKTLFPCFLPKSLLENIIIELNRSEQMSRRIKAKQSSKAPGQYDGTQKSDDAFRNVVMDRVFKKELLSTKKRWQA